MTGDGLGPPALASRGRRALTRQELAFVHEYFYFAIGTARWDAAGP